MTPSQGAWTDVGGANVPWWGILKNPLFTTPPSNIGFLVFPTFSAPVPTGTAFQEIHTQSIHVCLWGGSQAELQARAVQFRSSCHQPPPLHDGHVCLESCCEPVIVQGWFASEIKEASAFWKKILGHIACHFRKALQVQHFLSSAITASFCVRFK